MPEQEIRRRPAKDAAEEPSTSKGTAGDAPVAGAAPPAGKRRRWALYAGAVAAAFLLGNLSTLARERTDPVLRPFAGPKLQLLPEFLGEFRDRSLWGTYRPGLYFGMRMKQPVGLETGLLWLDPTREQDGWQGLRHQAQQSDGVGKFGWEQHDGEAFGRHEAWDGGARLTTLFTKRFCSGCRGGDWAARLQLAAAEPAAADGASFDPRRPRSLFFYVADQRGPGAGSVRLRLERSRDGGGSVLLASGAAWPLGGWQLHAVASDGGRLPALRFMGLAAEGTHNLTEAIPARAAAPAFQAFAPQGRRVGGGGGGSLPNATEPGANVALFQFRGPLPLSVDLVFTGSLGPPQPAWVRLWERLRWRLGPTAGGQLPWPPLAAPAEPVGRRVAALSGGSLSQRLAQASRAFDARFAGTFGSGDAADLPEGTAAVSKAALSNLLGGVGYFHGRSLVRLAGGVAESPPAALLTAVPSRSFFPRGFLWDEGFHQLLVQAWSPRLSRHILAHWLDLLNCQGWVAREQILGEEARTRVPAEFLVQDPSAANPPTLFLPLAAMARRAAAGLAGAEAAAEAAFLRHAFPRMAAWLDWFARTQRGQLPGSWRWRGRATETLPDPVTGLPSEFARELNPKTLTSGLDDYPRASHPSDEERHLDLHCWMALAARSLALIGSALKLPPAQVAPYAQLAAQTSDFALLRQLHWDAPAQQFRDWGNHTEAVRLDWRYVELPERYGGVTLPPELRKRRVDVARFVDAPPTPRFVPHFGYVSLFPLLMRLLPPAAPELGALLRQLAAPEALSPHGLQSLSAGSTLYRQRNTEHDQPYWRGQVWINVNYLALAALDHYAQAGGPNAAAAAALHDSLRARLLRTLVGGYRNSGFLWENYSERDGAGGGCRPFTGWSALLALVAGRRYVDI